MKVEDHRGGINVGEGIDIGEGSTWKTSRRSTAGRWRPRGKRWPASGPRRCPSPTPAGEWDVRALLNHVVSGNFRASELGAGATIEQVGDRFDGDLVGEPPSVALGILGDVEAQPPRARQLLDDPRARRRGVAEVRVHVVHVDPRLVPAGPGRASRSPTSSHPEAFPLPTAVPPTAIRRRRVCLR